MQQVVFVCSNGDVGGSEISVCLVGSRNFDSLNHKFCSGITSTAVGEREKHDWGLVA